MTTVNQEIANDVCTNNQTEWLKFPFEITDVDTATNLKLMKDFTGERTGFVQVGPKKWFFPKGYIDNAEIYYNLQPRQDDVWVVTFPRSGTTWMQELVWLLKNNLNYKAANKYPLDVRFPFLEFSSFVHPELKKQFLEKNSYCNIRCSLIEKLTTPAWKKFFEMSEKRFIKTHLPFELLSPKLLKTGSKVIYIVRNPKDVAVSFYHLNRLFRTQGFIGDFRTYWEYFENNLQPWTPYWSHIEQAWQNRNEQNLLLLFYEDMNKDLLKCIKDVASFLKVSYTDEEYKTLHEHLKIDNFRNNRSVNADVLKDLGIINYNEENFIRKGKCGDWRAYFDEDLARRVDKWIENNMKTHDLQGFPCYI